MTLARDTYCSFCGKAFEPPLVYPRTCAGCKMQVWANPIPVSVVLVPIARRGRTGLLVGRRAIEPRRGLLGLAGGFVEEHETWAQGGAREVREETGIHIEAARLLPFWFTSTEPRPNRILLFSVAPPVDGGSLAPFSGNSEVSERGLVFGPEGLESIFAFPLHAEAARRYFAERGISGAHDYAVI
jgi:ADP-ribose pyrophosphatase YjhB (NUDIX family)